jgi:hypothetical protein
MKTIVVSGGTSGIGNVLASTALIDAPPREPLTAIVEGRRIGLTLPSFDRDAAARLDTLTQALLRGEGPSAT